MHVISYKEELSIGSNSLFSANVFITNMDHDYKEIGVPVINQEFLSKNTKIGVNCFIGYGVVIQAGTILGDNCVVGANSVLRGEYPKNSVIVGAPGRIVKQWNYQKSEWEKITKNQYFKDEGI